MEAGVMNFVAHCTVPRSVRFDETITHEAKNGSLEIVYQFKYTATGRTLFIYRAGLDERKPKKLIGYEFKNIDFHTLSRKI